MISNIAIPEIRIRGEQKKERREKNYTSILLFFTRERRDIPRHCSARKKGGTGGGGEKEKKNVLGSSFPTFAKKGGRTLMFQQMGSQEGKKQKEAGKKEELAGDEWRLRPISRKEDMKPKQYSRLARGNGMG